jgi:hypothetical protein
MRIGDKRLGIDDQAWAVLKILAKRENDQGSFKTFSWYNGRERGVLLVVDPGRGARSMCIAFGECRGSDHIFVDMWEQTVYFEPPVTPAIVRLQAGDAYEKAYQHRATFSPEDYEAVSNHIEKLVSEFLPKKNVA